MEEHDFVASQHDETICAVCGQDFYDEVHTVHMEDDDIPFEDEFEDDQ